MTEQHVPAAVGKPLTWEQARPLVEALCSISQRSSDITAYTAAREAIRSAFPGQEGIALLFGRKIP